MKYYNKDGEPHYVQFDERHGLYKEINAFALHNIDVSLRRIAKSLENIVELNGKNDEVCEKDDAHNIIRNGECPLGDITVVDGGRFDRFEKIIEDESCS